MLFSRKFIVFLFYFFFPCHTLRCTTDCSYKYNFTQPFNIPEQCNQIVSAGKCSAYVEFSYTDQTYSVRINADPSPNFNELNNRHRAFIMLREKSSAYFTYEISYACKNKDDCARDLLSNAASDVLQRQFKVQAIVNELIPLIINPAAPVLNYTLDCYDPKGNIVTCGKSASFGQCVIEHEIKVNSVNRSCDNEESAKSVQVVVYQTPNSATFDIQCNQSLCNNNSTLKTVKDIMLKYNVTVTSDGHLTTKEFNLNYGSKLMASILMMIFSLILNYDLNAN